MYPLAAKPSAISLLFCHIPRTSGKYRTPQPFRALLSGASARYASMLRPILIIRPVGSPLYHVGSAPDLHFAALEEEQNLSIIFFEHADSPPRLIDDGLGA